MAARVEVPESLPLTPAARLAPQDVQRSTTYLHAGHILATARPAVVKMVLGSCVSVCLWDDLRRVGGANHFQLPEGGFGASARYGNVAMQQLVDRLLALGAGPRDLRAKLFGGARVSEATRVAADHLGARNVEIARRFLEQRGILVLAEDVGGHRGRTLSFQTDDGAAWVRRL